MRRLSFVTGLDDIEHDEVTITLEAVECQWCVYYKPWACEMLGIRVKEAWGCADFKRCEEVIS